MLLTRPILPTRSGESESGWTWDTYRDLTPPDGDPRYELIEGELRMSPSPNRRHQKVALALAIRLRECIALPGLGQVMIAPFDMRLSDDTAPQPDLLVVLAANGHRLLDTHLDGPCDLAVEILSPTGQARDRRRKRAVYADFKVPEYWIVDPMERTIQVLRLGDGHYPETVPFTRDDVVRSEVVARTERTVEWWLGE